MRSDQDRHTSWRPQQPPHNGEQRFADERFEGQYEKDPWRPDWRPDPRGREQEYQGGQDYRSRRSSGYVRRSERQSQDEEPYEPSERYEPFEPGHPREEGPAFGAGPPPRYLGTGFPGRGGPGFTGGYYGFGSGALEPDWRAGRGHPLAQGGQGGPQSDRRTERHYPPGPKGYQRSDERLREDISERLMEARYIDSSDVTVEVSAAKVVLDGTVPERRMKHAIEDLVDACPGVQDIDNKIRVRR